MDSDSLSNKLQGILEKHPGVAGVSIALIDGDSITPATAGVAIKSEAATEPMTANTFLEIASLSKTVGTAIVMNQFEKLGKDFESSSVNAVLEEVGSPFRLQCAPGKPKGWADQVLMKHLVNHTGLGMHYVFGIPLGREMPSILSLITDSPVARRYGYDAPLLVNKKPGTSFSYSGGGFLLLQHILECMYGGQDIASITSRFLSNPQIAGGDLTFNPKNLPGKTYAHGYLDNGDLVEDTRLMFPAFAAGALATPVALAKFLRCLALAFRDPKGCAGISNATARSMLGQDGLIDLGALDFMNAQVGLGVFVAQAGENRLMLHQAANDGFRGFYLVCFDGPAAAHGPRGIVVTCNGDNKGMFLNCDVAKYLLRDVLGFGASQGFDWSRVEGRSFSTEGVGQEQIVNLGLKGLVFDAFVSRPSRLPVAVRLPQASPRGHQVIMVEPLTEAAFAPFGQVVQAPESEAGAVLANQGTAARFNWLAKLENRREGLAEGSVTSRGRAALADVAVFRCVPRVLNPEGTFTVKLLERHEYSTQMFVPMTVADRYLVVVALGGSQPDTGTLRGFLARKDQGVNFAPGVWHHPLIALDSPCLFTCVVWEDDTEDDCHVVNLHPRDVVEVQVGVQSSL